MKQVDSNPLSTLRPWHLLRAIDAGLQTAKMGQKLTPDPHNPLHPVGYSFALIWVFGTHFWALGPWVVTSQGALRPQRALGQPLLALSCPFTNGRTLKGLLRPQRALAPPADPSFTSRLPLFFVLFCLFPQLCPFDTLRGDLGSFQP